MAGVGQTLRLTEFGKPSLISLDEWNEGWSDSCDLLQRVGALRVRDASTHLVVEATGMVGALRMPGRSVRVQPRWPEAYRAFRRMIRNRTTRNLVAETRQRTSNAPHLNDPAVGFVRALKETVSNGLPREYRPVEFHTQRPQGKLLAAKTLRQFHSNGVRHRAWCRVSKLTLDETLTSFVASVFGLLIDDPELPPTIRLELQQLEPWLDEATALSVERALDSVEALQERHERGDVLSLLRYGEAVLRENLDLWTTDLPVLGGECRFSNMARLWELTILAALRDQDEALEVADHPLSSRPPLLLSQGGPTINPDLAIYTNGVARSIVDAKYTLADAPAASDVYQVVCYAERLGFPTATLFYLSDHEWRSDLGRSVHGVSVAAFGIDRRNVENGLRTAATHLSAEKGAPPLGLQQD